MYRVCRVQWLDGRFWFTLPLDTLVFETVKQAFEHLTKRAILGFNYNVFWVQESIVDDNGLDGKIWCDFPKDLPGLKAPSSSNPSPVYIEGFESEPEVPAKDASVPRKLSPWEETWGYKKPVLRGS